MNLIITKSFPPFRRYSKSNDLTQTISGLDMLKVFNYELNHEEFDNRSICIQMKEVLNFSENSVKAYLINNYKK